MTYPDGLARSRGIAGPERRWPAGIALAYVAFKARR